MICLLTGYTLTANEPQYRNIFCWHKILGSPRYRK